MDGSKNIIMTATLITIPILLFISGFAKAVMDLSEEGKLKFKNYFFWWKDYAWKNKWKLKDNGVPVLKNGQYIPKFWQSDNLFVIFTDAWHLFGLIERISFAIAFILSGLLIASNIWFIFFALGCYILFATTFHIFYTYIFKK